MLKKWFWSTKKWKRLKKNYTPFFGDNFCTILRGGGLNGKNPRMCTVPYIVNRRKCTVCMIYPLKVLQAEEGVFLNMNWIWRGYRRATRFVVLITKILIFFHTYFTKTVNLTAADFDNSKYRPGIWKIISKGTYYLDLMPFSQKQDSFKAFLWVNIFY